MKPRILYLFILGMFCSTACAPVSPTPFQISATVIPVAAATIDQPVANPSPSSRTTGKYLPFFSLFTTQDDGSQALRQVAFELKTNLPEGPETVMLYRQDQVRPGLTSEKAVAVAVKVGITGSTTSYTDEGGGTTYKINDGKGEVLVFSDLPLWFTYNSDAQPVTGNPEKLYSLAERSQAAVDFLKAHQLLDFEYSVRTVANSNWSDFSVAIVPALNGYSLFENNPSNPRIQVALDGSDKVHVLYYQALALKPLQTVMIRPAKAVWADFQTHRLNDQSYLRWVNPIGDPGKIIESISPATKATVEKAEIEYFAAEFRGEFCGSNFSRRSLLDSAADLAVYLPSEGWARI